MKRILIFVFLVNIIFTLGSFFVLPERVAIHFGSEGLPDGWATRKTHLFISLGLDFFMFFLFYFLPKMIRFLPKGMLNIPHKAYWTQPEHLAQLHAIFDDWMYELGAAMMLFFLVVGGLTLKANLDHPIHLNEPVFFVVLGLFFLYVFYWIFQLFSKLKPSQG